MKKKSAFLLLIALSIFALSCNTNATPDQVGENAVAGANKSLFNGFESEVQWGQHIVTVSGCNDCHTPKKMTDHGPILDTSLLLAGHPAQLPKIDVNRKEAESKGLIITRDLTEWVGPWGTSYAANLTPDPTGIGAWKEEQLFVALREGKFKGLKNSRNLLPPMPWEMFRNFTDSEIKAIFAYLTSIPPVSNVVPAPIPPSLASK
jgi:hypothetical protein